ncbi:hypothetical protein B0A52_01507 [Exophiala mesophila]|uniref:Sec20 C-terminal domain-containing protein n=1 Tax=Exophiala mesophila TaxID=212818 RepID=A0A438NF71_EXOME|nr:hypothetical protein B0A52_01507 [Exophiala mesophila]
MPSPLTQRLQALGDSYKQTSALIQELKHFTPDATKNDDADRQRLDLANEIHANLKEQEDTLEILRQEVNDDDVPQNRREAPLDTSSRDNEVNQNADMVVRLTEDLRSARAAFRRAQLQAKRQCDVTKRKERESLFSDRKSSVEAGDSKRRSKHEKLSQDELALRSAEDVTQALRRVHAQLEGELQQSQFAQQTLDESQEALKSLTESYSGTTDLLKASRGLVSQLVRSNKSDTWYLVSTWYLLAGTLLWLFYRRILYGPSLLLIYYPFRMLWFTLSSLGSIGAAFLGGKPVSDLQTPSQPTLSEAGQHYTAFSSNIPGADGISGDIPESSNTDESVIEHISRLAGQTGSNTADGAEARNTKKRMMEVDVDIPPAQARDEL